MLNKINKNIILLFIGITYFLCVRYTIFVKSIDCFSEINEVGDCIFSKNDVLDNYNDCFICFDTDHVNELYTCDIEINRALQSQNDCSAYSISCGEGREQGYSSTFLSTGCRNWEGFSFGNYGLVDIPYWIDMSSMNTITNSVHRNLLIEDIRTQASIWNEAIMHDGTGQIINLYEVGIGSLTRPDDINGKRVVEIVREDGEYSGEFSGPIPIIRPGCKIKINYDDSGVGDRPGRNIDTPMHELGHLLGLSDIDVGFTYGTHKTIMGYERETTEATLRDAITYHDIQGIAVINNRHNNHQFTRYVYDENCYLHFCFYCDTIDARSTPISGSTHMIDATMCTHDYQQMVSLGNKHWLKCTKCYKVVESDFLVHGAYDGTEYYLIIDSPIDNDLILADVPNNIGGNVVRQINTNAFKNCSNLTSITLPNTITSIGDSAFEACTNLFSILLPSNLTYLGESVFKGCNSLTSITIPSSISFIRQSVFENCTGLSSIAIPNSVTTIGTSAFKGCTSLSSIELGQNVSCIGDYAFMNCTSLGNVTIGRDITSITLLGTGVFNNFSSSLTIKVPINRLADYKNETSWIPYKNIITSDPLSFDEIDINCLSNNESRSVYLEQYKRKLYKINVSCDANYKVQVTGLVRTHLYDANMLYISTNFNTYYLNLDNGVYYIDMEYDYQEYGYANISFSSYNYSGNYVHYGSNNCLTHLHPVYNTFSLNELIFNNTQGPGFYKFALAGEKVDLSPLLYYEGAIAVFNDDARTQFLDKLDISNYSYDALTNQTENSMWVFLPRSGYFYIDIYMPTANYTSLSLTISSPENQEIDIFDLPSVMSYQNISLMTNVSERSDYVKEIEIKQVGIFNISCSYSGIQSQSIDVFLITKDDLDIKYITTLSSSNTFRSSIMLLEEGTYYLGYFDLRFGTITDIHLNRYVDNTSSEVFNTLITDPNIYSCGSEITILEDGITIKSFYSNIITEGFTRLIYLDNNYCNYSLSRLDYYWYSSDSSKALVTSYGTVLGVNSTEYNETVTILAVLKSDPSIIYVKDFIIREDSGAGSIVVYNNYSIKYSNTNNGVFHLKLEELTIPYPMYTYYIWTTTNVSSGLVVSNDNWGNYTVNSYGSFTLSASDYIYNDRITIYIYITVTNN